MQTNTLIYGLTLCLATGCETRNTEYKNLVNDPEFVHRTVKKLSDVIVYDIFSPPVASRVYVYPSIAGYEVLINDYPEQVSLAGQVHGLREPPKPKAGMEYCLPLASVHAFVTVGKALVFSEEKIEAFENEIYQEFRATGMPSDVYDRSLEYGSSVATHILDWASKDNYSQTRTFPKFDVTDQQDRWLPTPPDYMDPIEPHWNEIRTFVIDSAQQFVPPRPTEYDMNEASLFYKEVLEVYEVGVNLDTEQKEIANFWDCNPYVSHHLGHVMFATKKITPGGHWMGITAITGRTANSNIMQTMEAYALVSIALADGFMSAWDEKYRSNLVRPETVINRHIDEEWVPILQTPPFPEYTSAHSVISRAAAITLTSLYGESFSFRDTTENEFGLPTRTFDSFMEASEEAAISRLYGGIHYMPAIVNGVEQGGKVGRFIVENLKTRKSS